MFTDVLLISKSDEALKIARILGFSKIYFNEDIKQLKIEYVEDYDKKRAIVKNGKIKILLNPHLVTRKDSLHFRSSGLDQVICKVMNENGISMAISLDKINNYINIGRIKQNIKLCRKYHVRILFFTFADNIYGMRSVKDLISFLEILGMTPGEAKQAISNL